MGGKFRSARRLDSAQRQGVSKRRIGRPTALKEAASGVLTKVTSDLRILSGLYILHPNFREATRRRKQYSNLRAMRTSARYSLVE